MRVVPKLLKLIKDNKSFLIVGHINPEGDSIGSGIALALGLKKMGKSAYILSKDPVPDILRFLPHAALVCTKIPAINFDVLILIDCNSIERTGFSVPGGSDRGGKHLSAKNTAIIDHHIVTGEDKRQVGWIDPSASAAGELVYKLLVKLSVSIDKKIATNLYTAIFTDTGGFRYSNTTSESLTIASRLIQAGADPWYITKEVYESNSFNRMKLLALSLKSLERKGTIAWITVTQRMLKNTHTSEEDTEYFVDYPRKIKGIEVALFFRENRNNSYKLSFRSKGKVNVADIAGTFGGGGHVNAAGCTIDGSLQKVKDKALRAVRKAMKNQNKNHKR